MSAHRHLVRTFATGFLALFPLAATVLILGWAVNLLLDYLGPQSSLGRGLAGLGLGNSYLAGYLLGLGALVVGIYTFGLLVETRLQRTLHDWLRRGIQRIPLVRTLYDVMHRMVELMGASDAAELKSMQAVWCSFSPRDGEPGTKCLALLSSPEPVMIDGHPHLAVLIPTAPVPIGGGLLYLPQAWVSPADVSMEGVTSLYVSMGVTTPEVLGSRRPHSAKFSSKPLQKQEQTSES